MGVLRLMSYLTPDKLPIGFTLTRKLAEQGYDKNKLHRLDRLPTNLPNPIAIASMALKHLGRGESVLLVSEGLGPQRWHGHVAILVNEHTVSAGEMVAAFASENGLATLVGVDTAGRLIPGSGFKVGHGYMLIMPKAQYITWEGRRFEGEGVKPSVFRRGPSKHLFWKRQSVAGCFGTTPGGQNCSCRNIALMSSGPEGATHRWTLQQLVIVTFTHMTASITPTPAAPSSSPLPTPPAPPARIFRLRLRIGPTRFRQTHISILASQDPKVIPLPQILPIPEILGKSSRPILKSLSAASPAIAAQQRPTALSSSKQIN